MLVLQKFVMIAAKCKTALVILMLIAAATLAAEAQTKRKRAAAAPKKKAGKLTSQQEAARANKDLLDALNGKSKKPLLTEEELKSKGAAAYEIKSDGAYTNYALGFSAKFADRSKFKPPLNNFADDFQVFVDVSDDSQMWFSGLTPDYTCDSAESCAQNVENNYKTIGGFEVVKKEPATVGELPAVRLIYKMDSGASGKKAVWDNYYVFRKIGGKPYSYKFILHSTDDVSEKDKAEFERAIGTVRFDVPRN